jgi:hypothetical protein
VADVLKVIPLVDPGSIPETSLRATETPTGFTVSFIGTPGLNAQLQRSFDLMRWLTIQETEVPAQGRVDYTETNRLSAAFYRVKTH